MPLFLKRAIRIKQIFSFFSSVAQSRPTLCGPMDCSTLGFPVLKHQLPEFTHTHVHWVSDTIQPFYPLLSPPALNLSQYQGRFKWVSSSHQVGKVLEFQHQHQSSQWIFRTDLWEVTSFEHIVLLVGCFFDSLQRLSRQLSLLGQALHGDPLLYGQVG